MSVLLIFARVGSYPVSLSVYSAIRILFLPTHSFDGDVLQALPVSFISGVVGLLMTFVICVTAPLIAIPCGEMIEGKLSTKSRHFIFVRISLCSSCTFLAAFVPGFVRIISFVGCFCVSTLGFVLPPVFCLKLATHKKCASNVVLLLIGAATTIATSTMTFRDLVNFTGNVKANHYIR